MISRYEEVLNDTAFAFVKTDVMHPLDIGDNIWSVSADIVLMSVSSTRPDGWVRCNNITVQSLGKRRKLPKSASENVIDTRKPQKPNKLKKHSSSSMLRSNRSISRSFQANLPGNKRNMMNLSEVIENSQPEEVRSSKKKKNPIEPDNSNLRVMVSDAMLNPQVGEPLFKKVREQAEKRALLITQKPKKSRCGSVSRCCLSHYAVSRTLKNTMRGLQSSKNARARVMKKAQRMTQIEENVKRNPLLRSVISKAKHKAQRLVRRAKVKSSLPDWVKIQYVKLQHVKKFKRGLTPLKKVNSDQEVLLNGAKAKSSLPNWVRIQYVLETFFKRKMGSKEPDWVKIQYGIQASNNIHAQSSLLALENVQAPCPPSLEDENDVCTPPLSPKKSPKYRFEQIEINESDDNVESPVAPCLGDEPEYMIGDESEMMLVEIIQDAVSAAEDTPEIDGSEFLSPPTSASLGERKSVSELIHFFSE